MLDEERFRKPETTDDIIREMRDLGALDEKSVDMIPRSLQALGMRTYAARLEAARKRERIQRDKVSFRCGDCARFGDDCDAGDSDGNEDRVACEKFVRRALVPGNAASMRAALEYVKEKMGSWWEYLEVAPKVEAALAAPPRNCDVGTPEEQEARYKAFCSRYYGTNDMSGDNCRVCPLSPFGCQFAWMQMPYEAGGAE